MVDREEYQMFVNEIGNLLREYDRCKSDRLKREIYEDIILLTNAIETQYS